MSFQQLYKFLCIIAELSLLLPIALCFYKYRAFNNILKALLVFLILNLISDLISLTLVSDPIATNILFNIFTFFECSIIFFIYIQEYKTKSVKALIIILFTFFALYALKKFILDGKYISDDSDISVFEAIIVIFLSGVYFVKIIIDDNILQLGKYSFYWINLSFFLFFSASLLIVENIEFLNRCDTTIACYLYSLYQITNITCNILFSVGIWKTRKI